MRDLTFAEFRAANVARNLKWHPGGLVAWSPADWMTAVVGEVGELASLLKMRNRERDGLPGNKFSPTDQQVADELADVLTYLDLLAAALGVDLARAAVEKFNAVSKRVGFPDRIEPARRDDGWLEAARAWSVCASIHRQFGKGRDAVFSTRQADYLRHMEAARQRAGGARHALIQAAIDIVGGSVEIEAQIRALGDADA